MIKTFKSRWMNRTVVDPRSLDVGDRVEVCYCDTSATCVWSFTGKVFKDEKGKLFIKNESDNRNDPPYPLDSFEDDGCYTYLDKPFK